MAIAISFSSCKKFLSPVPKGLKVPTTLADFEAMIRDEYQNHRFYADQAVLLLNDKYETASNLGYDPLSEANYNWRQGVDRTVLNNSDESVYYAGYAAIATFNLIKGYAPTATEATEEQRKELVAQAKVLSANRYFTLVNYYADVYDKATASSKLSIPLIESADIDAPHRQVSIAEMYDHMLKNIEEALPDLPKQGATALHPTVGAAYALRARIYLQMEEYQLALDAANLALEENNKLFDWTAFYTNYETDIVKPDFYPSFESPMNYSYTENYMFSHGTTDYSAREDGLLTDRGERFEEGDAMFASRWKLRTVGQDTYYYSITRGHYNKGGITTAEVYLIKAECQAHLNDVNGAMETLTMVREKRILPAFFEASAAASVNEAVEKIRLTKDNELVGTIIPFADMRRFNKYPEYATTLTKTEQGQNLSLPPDSHMWTMPFPLGALKNPGNGTIEQNVNK